MLASMEIGKEASGLEKYGKISLTAADQLEQSIIWYASLAMVQADRMEGAARNLEILVNAPGPYHSDAVRLQKLLLK